LTEGLAGKPHSVLTLGLAGGPIVFEGLECGKASQAFLALFLAGLLLHASHSLLPSFSCADYSNSSNSTIIIIMKSISICILSLLALCIPAAADLDRTLRKGKKGKGKCPSSGSDSFDDLSELLFTDTCDQIVISLLAGIGSDGDGGDGAIADGGDGDGGPSGIAEFLMLPCFVRGGAVVSPYYGGDTEAFFLSLLSGNVYCCPVCDLPSDESLMEDCYDQDDADECDDTVGILVTSYDTMVCCPNPDGDVPTTDRKLKQAPRGMIGRALESLQKKKQE
jgi:hypothetical protein